MKTEEIKSDLDHFLDKINYGASFLDARAIRFMNEGFTEIRKRLALLDSVICKRCEMPYEDHIDTEYQKSTCPRRQCRCLEKRRTFSVGFPKFDTWREEAIWLMKTQKNPKVVMGRMLAKRPELRKDYSELKELIAETLYSKIQ